MGGGGRQQLQKFCAEFSRHKPQKNSAKFLQSGWTAQGFKTKKHHQTAEQQPADAKQKKLSQPIKN